MASTQESVAKRWPYRQAADRIQKLAWALQSVEQDVRRSEGPIEPAAAHERARALCRAYIEEAMSEPAAGVLYDPNIPWKETSRSLD